MITGTWYLYGIFTFYVEYVLRSTKQGTWLVLVSTTRNNNTSRRVGAASTATPSISSCWVRGVVLGLSPSSATAGQAICKEEKNFEPWYVCLITKGKQLGMDGSRRAPSVDGWMGALALIATIPSFRSRRRMRRSDVRRIDGTLKEDSAVPS
jgi:hypothetical protein